MKTFLSLLLVTFSAVAEHRNVQPNLSRPPLNMRSVVGVIPQGDTIDVYWAQTNELRTPIRTVLHRTTISGDGRTRLKTAVVRDEEGTFQVSVDGEGSNVQMLWTRNGKILASPVVDGTLVYPEGKLVFQYGQHAGLECRGDECLVTFDAGPVIAAAIIDGDSNVTGNVIELPEGFAPSRTYFDERGILYVRQTLTELRAALVDFDGTVLYDVPVVAVDPLHFQTSPIGVAHNGVDHVIAYVDRSAEPDDVNAVTIAEDGTMGEPVRLFQAGGAGHSSNVSLAWNGSSYAAAAGYVHNGPELTQRFDANFQPLGAPLAGLPLIHELGSRFALIWSGYIANARPSISILGEDGGVTPPLEIDPMPKRRAVR